MVRISKPATDLSVREEALGIFAIQLYSDAQCASTIRELRSSKSWHKGKVSAAEGNSKAVVLPKTRSALVLGPREKKHLCSDFEHKIRTIIQPLILKLWGARFHRCEGTQLIRYDPGGLYVPHRDSTENPSDVVCASRYFSALCYLNNDFAGGRTCFPGLDYSATPEPGKTLIFPSYYLHSAEPVTAGQKFVLLSWVCGPLPIRWI